MTNERVELFVPANYFESEDARKRVSQQFQDSISKAYEAGRRAAEPSGVSRLERVEHRLIRAESEILKLGSKALETDYMKQFPEPYIPGDSV